MSPAVKFFAALVVFAIWGPYLLYVWITENVPSWAIGSVLRKTLMLSREFEPTIFTLIFGVMFTGFVAYGLFGYATGNAYYQKMERQGRR